MRINHNISALNAYRNLATNNINTSKSLEKLSSGLRINRASDDAAGLAISEKMRSQIRGLQMAERNALDGISLIQTAEGALSTTHEVLQRMRELAVQAANDTYTETDRLEIQKEINQLTSEVNRIGNSSEYNTATLLDGSRTNNFQANGKSFTNGSTLLSNAATGVAVAITNGDALALDNYSIEVTKSLAGKANPANIIPTQSGIFGAYGDALNGQIGVTTSATADDWTLTLEKGKNASFSDGTNSFTDSTTGVTASIVGDGSSLTPGVHSVKVSATPVGETFPDGSTSYTFAPSKTELTVSGSGAYSFVGDAISYDLSQGNPTTQVGETITLTYVGANTFEITNSGNTFKDTYTVGTAYNDHGLSFQMDSATGFAANETLTFTIDSATGAKGTKQQGFGTANTGSNDITFAQPITVDTKVGTGNWTLTKLSSGFKVEFAGTDKSGNPLTITDTIGPNDPYNAHGVSFQVASVNMDDNDTITFSTTKPEQSYDFVVDIDGVSQTVASNVKGSGSPITSTESISGNTSFNGLSIDATNLTEGQFTFTVDPAIKDKFNLSNADGTKTAQIEVGQSFDNYGLQFQINHSGSLINGESITFSTVDPVDGYEYQMSLNGGTPVTVATDVPDGVDPIVLAFDGFAGFELNSLELKEGKFTFGVAETGTGEDNSLTMQIGANAGQTVSLEINDMRAKVLQISNDVDGGGASQITLANGTTQTVWYTTTKDITDGITNSATQYAIDVTSAEKAQAAITVFDDAIQKVSSERARLGAIQNRLEHTVNNLNIMSENVTSSESRIRDLDMALEMSNFTKNNILNQAAQAMLSQANQMPQGVLQLLK